jgi:predicted XRE-type DNA-binding protein
VKSASYRPGHITTGDIFDDLGFPAAETLEMKIKAEIWQALLLHIGQRGFRHAYLVTTLKAHQPDVSNLLRGKITKISITKLIQFAGRLNLEARIKLTSAKATGKTLPSVRASRAKAGKSKRELAFAT